MRDTLRATWYLLVTSVVGIAWASLLVSLLATGVGTLVIVVGAFILMATARLVHLVEAAEVGRAARFLHAEVPTTVVEPAIGPPPATVPARLRQEWTSSTVRGALAGVARMATGPALLAVTIVLWAVPLGLASTPILVAADLEPTKWTEHVESVVDVAERPSAIAMTVVGLLLSPLAAVGVQRLAAATAERTLAVAASLAPVAEPQQVDV